MEITPEVLEANRDALVAERDGYLEESERLRAQATAVGGAIRIVEHLLELARAPEDRA